MAVDTPARIAVLGAGPTGLEAALYARFLGYDVSIFASGNVGERLLSCIDGEITGPAKQYCSRLGIAALLAQDETWWPPDPETVFTGSQLRDAYFLPLSESDLLSGSLETQTEVVRIERADGPASDEDGDDDEDDEDDEDDDELNEDDSHPFHILVRDAKGREREETAHVLIDATGDTASANWIAASGTHPAQITTAGMRSQNECYRALSLDPNRVEPSLYVVGTIHTGESPLANPQLHLAQIRQVFAIVGGRENLDLYRTIQLPPEWQAFLVPNTLV